MMDSNSPRETLVGWLQAATRSSASDLHLVAGHPPVVRRHGQLATLEDQPVLAGKVLSEIARSILRDAFAEKFAENKNADFSYEAEWDGRIRRCRVNVFQARGQVGLCFRIIPETIPTFEWAGFPQPTAQRLVHFLNGLVLITGVAGSGKSTTLAMLIDLLNRRGGRRIITVEEPVEYLFEPVATSVVTQREVGSDVESFADGLKFGLRQDPDVILVGEIRDRETAQMALSAAETGHLVFSTLHTRDAKGAISRFADLFPQTVQMDIRSQLSLALRSVVSQHLLPSIVPGEKQELAIEILFNNHPIASSIRFGKLESIDNFLLTGRNEGMLPLDESIRRLYEAGRITRETGERFVSHPKRIGS